MTFFWFCPCFFESCEGIYFLCRCAGGNGRRERKTMPKGVFGQIRRRMAWGLAEPQQAGRNIPKGYSGSLLVYGREISKSILFLTRILSISANTRFDFYSNNSDFNFSSSRSAIGVKIWYFFQIKYIFVSSFGVRGRKTSPLSGFVSIKCSKVKR